MAIHFKAKTNIRNKLYPYQLRFLTNFKKKHPKNSQKLPIKATLVVCFIEGHFFLSQHTNLARRKGELFFAALLLVL